MQNERKWATVLKNTFPIAGIVVFIGLSIVIVDSNVSSIDLAGGDEPITLVEDADLSYPINPLTVSSKAESHGGDITFDDWSENSADTSAQTLTISHDVATGDDRYLLVGAAAEDGTLADCDVTEVTYNSVHLAKADEATAGTSPYMCVDLWYLAGPPTGTHDIVITWNGNVDNRNGGGISLQGAMQDDPEATTSQSLDSATSITTSVTTLTDKAWVVDAVGSGNTGSGFDATETDQTERYDVSASTSAGAGSTKLVATAGSTDMTWDQAANRMAHALAAITPTGLSTMTISHTVLGGDDRILVVGAQGEDTSATDCDVTGITYNSVALTKATEATAGTTFYMCTDLWYLLGPAVGTHDIVITWAGPVDNRNAGAVTLYGAAQQAPEAIANQIDNAPPAGSITTSITTITNGAMVVDAIGSGNPGSGFATGESGQTEVYDVASASSAGAGSTREVATAGSTDMTWTQSANRFAHALAAFARSTPP